MVEFQRGGVFFKHGNNQISVVVRDIVYVGHDLLGQISQDRIWLKSRDGSMRVLKWWFLKQPLIVWGQAYLMQTREMLDSVVTMAAKRNCFCNVPYKVESDRQKVKTAKCGSVVDYKEGRLGCNLYAPVGDVAGLWDALSKSKRFNVYTLNKYPIVYEEEWPKCVKHSAYMALKKCSKIGNNEGRYF